MARLFDGFLIAVVLGVWGIGAARAMVLGAGGVRVLAVDRQRTLVQGLTDLTALGAFTLWAYEAVAFAWPFRRHLVPGRLHAVLFHSSLLQALGVLAILTGLLVWLAAMAAMGSAWRIGIDRRTPGGLVTHGIFAWTRNPIYAAFDLLVIGTFLVQGRVVFLLLAVALVPLLDLQIRREERFLAELHGAAYRDYCARVGRYVTARGASARGRSR